MSMLKQLDKDYSDGRTKQSFKDSTDINKILKKAQKAGGISHALRHDAAEYGEFTGVDLLGHYEQINRARVIFDDLPSEVRREFDQDALKFAGYASDPANIHRLKELIPSIAEPADFFPNPVSRGGAATPPVLQEGDVPPIVPPVAPPAAPPAAEGGVSEPVQV